MSRTVADVHVCVMCYSLQESCSCSSLCDACSSI